MFSTTAAELHNTALANLDTWLSQALYQGLCEYDSNALVPFICFAMSPGQKLDTLFSPYSAFGDQKIVDEINHIRHYISTDFLLDTHYVISNPHQASYQAIKTLNIDLDITVLEYYLKLGKYSELYM